MTELEKAANEFAGVNYDCEDESDSFYHMIQKDAFKAGAEWAIDKACKWLKFNYTEFLNSSRLGIDIDEMIKDFKMDMKEE